MIDTRRAHPHKTVGGRFRRVMNQKLRLDEVTATAS